jgi:hypothetical protein
LVLSSFELQSQLFLHHREGRDLFARRAFGRRMLAAAWGFMSGIAYSSLLVQLANFGATDPSGFSPLFVVTFKAFGLAFVAVFSYTGRCIVYSFS